MTATPIPFSTKDNCVSQLSAGVNASDTSLLLLTGQGALFPQAYTGTASSGGSGTTLNSTGILAAVGGSSSAMTGKIVWNKTEGSIGIITAVGTNALTCTRLIKADGTAGSWSNGDRYCINPFVVTLAVVSTSSYGVTSITQYEEVLIIARSTDTLTVASGGRGYSGTTANSFSTNDYVYLFSTSPIVEGFKDVVSVIAQQQDTDRTTLSTATTNITNLQTGAYQQVTTSGSANAYVAATPGLAAYAAGNEVYFNANFTNTGSATLNVNSLGAKTVKKIDGATNLVAGDIQSGQIVHVRYDGTNFQMLSPVGQTSAQDDDVLNSNIPDASSVASTTVETNFDQNYSIASGKWVAGVIFRVTAVVRMTVTNTKTARIRLKLGSTTITGADKTYTNAGGGVSSTAVVIQHHIVCTTTGATGTVADFGHWATTNAADFGTTSETIALANVTTGSSTDSTTQTTTIDTTGSLTLQFSITFNNSSSSDTARLQRLIVERLAVN